MPTFAAESQHGPKDPSAADLSAPSNPYRGAPETQEDSMWRVPPGGGPACDTKVELGTLVIVIVLIIIIVMRPEA